MRGNHEGRSLWEDLKYPVGVELLCGGLSQRQGLEKAGPGDTPNMCEYLSVAMEANG